MIKAIIFDIGGGLFNESISLQYEEIAKRFNINPKLFIAAKDKHMNRAKIGEITEDEFIKRIADELSINKNMLARYWKEIYMQKTINNDIVMLIKRLKQMKYSLIVLSNANPVHAEINYKRGLYSIFDKVYLSNEIKMAKPDKKIYDYVLKKSKLKPEECIFIDDREENVLVANELGIKGIVFTGYKEQIYELNKYLL